eukprot:scpid78826/ scgid19009/ 
MYVQQQGSACSPNCCAGCCKGSEEEPPSMAVTKTRIASESNMLSCNAGGGFRSRKPKSPKPSRVHCDAHTSSRIRTMLSPMEFSPLPNNVCTVPACLYEFTAHTFLTTTDMPLPRSAKQNNNYDVPVSDL